MTAAIFGLIGVLVGGLLATGGQYLLGVRNEYAAATVAARLIAAELDRVAVAVDAGDLADPNETVATPVFDTHQAALALVVPAEYWRRVADAYTELAVVRAGELRPQAFTDAAASASEALKAAAGPDGPLRRRGSPLERWMAHWPRV